MPMCELFKRQFALLTNRHHRGRDRNPHRNHPQNHRQGRAPTRIDPSLLPELVKQKNRFENTAVVKTMLDFEKKNIPTFSMIGFLLKNLQMIT